jgi:hypothetical protein
MKKYQYNCTLLTDIIITSLAATEGYNESLDYIPGSKFLGIVAGKLYDEHNLEKTLDIFHNGMVKFTDATPILNGETLNKVPLAWYHKKGDNLSSNIYLHHRLKEVDYKKFRNEELQLKQAKNGYFSSIQNKFIVIDQDFSLKSAHDSLIRKSKDGQMFGYFSLKIGSTWTFYVVDENGEYADEIKAALEGKHRIGRSRSAEYGLVEINYIKVCSERCEGLINDEVVIYAQSNLCFYNNYGQSTAIPCVQQLVGSKNATILWEKCQIRSRNYKTWNRHRYNKDADKIIIERGSVFVVHLINDVSSNYFTKGIGSHKNEGFGNVLANPVFLLSSTYSLPFKLEKAELNYEKFYTVEKGLNDKEILDILSLRKKRSNSDYNIDQKVNAFIKEYEQTFKGITKSQWGTLRNYGKNMPDKKAFETMVFDPDAGFLYKGQSENDWRTKNRRVILKEHLDKLDERTEYLSYVVKLSNLMAKK